VAVELRTNYLAQVLDNRTQRLVAEREFVTRGAACDWLQQMRGPNDTVVIAPRWFGVYVSHAAENPESNNEPQ